jgi:transcriptional regulator with XRE-family HTH domain
MISLNDMAERLGISPGYWSRVERSIEGPPSDELVERVAAILGIPMDELFIEAKRLPPDMRQDMGRVVLAYRRLRAMRLR